jgi:hypothetical protein
MRLRHAHQQKGSLKKVRWAKATAAKQSTAWFYKGEFRTRFNAAMLELGIDVIGAGCSLEEGPENASIPMHTFFIFGRRVQDPGQSE